MSVAPLCSFAEGSRESISLSQPFLSLTGDGEPSTIASKPVGDTDKVTFSNYFQFQYRDTDQSGKTQHSFEARRIRLGATMEINERATAKVSYDMAANTDRSDGELKDFLLTYKPGQEGLSIIGGQFALPIGYETATSNSVLEFPERVTVNRTLFSDERIRGVMVEQKGSTGTSWYAGVSNSLTTKDKEQDNLAPGTGGQLAGFVGVKHDAGDTKFGIGYFAGKRPEFVGTVATSPEVDRRFLVVDGQMNNLLTPGLFLKAEVLMGQDRVPSTTGGVGLVANDLNGYHATLGYKTSELTDVFVRLSVFDPNEDTDGDAIKEYGVALRYSLGKGANFTVSHEIFEDAAVANSPYQVCTFRVQFKF